MTYESLRAFINSKLFAGIVTGVCITLVVICIFEVGVMVGYHEANYSSRWGENYTRNFGSGTMGMHGITDANRPMPDGITGKIVSVTHATASSTELVISDSQHPEEKVLIVSDTIIRDHQNTLSPASLSVDEEVVVLGSPDTNGEIVAKLVIIIPTQN